MLTRTIGLLVLGAWLAGCAGVQADPATGSDRADRPNIIILYVDDQGYSDLSPWPPGRAADSNMPNVDRLIDGGAQFANAYASSPICSPSRNGLITGRYQQRWNIYWYDPAGLPDGKTTLAQILKDRGYTNGYFGKVHYGRTFHDPDNYNFPTRHGYDEFYGYLNHTIHYTKHRREYVEGQPEEMHGRFGKGPMWINEEQHDQEGFATELFGEATRRFIERNHDRPFHAFLSFNAPHNWVDQLPEDYVEEHNLNPFPEWTPDQDYMEWFMEAKHPDQPEGRRWYLAQMEFVDREVGRILDQLERLGIRDNTLIFYSNDNGGSTGGSYACNVPLAGSKFTLTEGGIRVPLIVNWPARIPAGQTLYALSSQLDIAPTIAAAAGAPARVDWDGRDLLPLMTGQAPDRLHERLFWDTRHEFAVREGDWKLRVVRNMNQVQMLSERNYIRVPPQVSLYHLGNDIGEQRNLADRHPEKVEALRQVHARWRSQMR